MPLILSTGAAALPALQQLYAAYSQNQQANRLRLQDTTTPAEREALAMGRQTAYAQMPGETTAVNRLNQAAQQGAANAGQGAISAGGFQGALTRIDANRANAITNLADQSGRYRQGQFGILQGLLARKGAREYQDQQTFARDKAALTEGAAKNMFGGLTTVANAGVFYGMNKMAQDAAGKKSLGGVAVSSAGGYRPVTGADGPSRYNPDTQAFEPDASFNPNAATSAWRKAMIRNYYFQQGQP